MSVEDKVFTNRARSWLVFVSLGVYLIILRYAKRVSRTIFLNRFSGCHINTDQTPLSITVKQTFVNRKTIISKNTDSPPVYNLRALKVKIIALSLTDFYYYFFFRSIDPPSCHSDGRVQGAFQQITFVSKSITYCGFTECVFHATSEF